MRCTFFVVLLCLITSLFNYSSAQNKTLFEVNPLKNSIYEGVFTGNGLLGTMTLQKSPQIVQVNIGRTDVYDHRDDGNYVLFSAPRLPIGHFEITFNQDFESKGIIDLNTASATAFLSNGISLRTITLSNKDIILLFIKKNVEDQPYSLQFVPEIAKSPRFNFSYTAKPETFVANTDVKSFKNDNIQFFQQELLAGGGYVTAFKQIQKGIEDIYAVTIAYDTVNDSYLQSATNILKTFDKYSIPSAIDQHQSWWSTYNKQSTYSIPDKKLQAFYDMQLYKLASGTRADKPALDLQGPWTSSTPWPGYWFNLNMQLTYSPLYTANRLDIARSMIQMIEKNKNQLIANVHEDYQYNSAALGRNAGPDMKSRLSLHAKDTATYKDEFVEMSNLTWLLYYYYQHYRHSMDESLKLPLYDLLKRSVNYSIHLLAKNQNGQYEFIVKSHSPEYPNSYDYNTNYDLSNLRWGLKTLQELGKEIKSEKKYLKHIRNIESKLIPYPTNETGLKISSNQSYETSHRHYSHLMMIYPYYMMNMEQANNRELITKSITHWQSKTGALQGYSLSGAASMYAMMGDGDKALDYLLRLNKQFIQPNTLYKESGPVIETPLAMAQSLQELSLQYWNGILRIFPAIPSTWKNVSFSDFLTDGAFLVSATYQDGQTKQVKITAQTSGSLKVKPNITHVEFNIDGEGKVRHETKEILNITLKKGSSILLFNKKNEE